MIEVIGSVRNGVIVPDSPLRLREGSRVRIIGEAEVSPEFDNQTFWADPTLEELVEQQQTPILYDVGMIPQIWPESDLNDGFEEAYKDWRRGRSGMTAT
jgi:predicted DNA-binding antitoxin AbrB/MazE fold protein